MNSFFEAISRVKPLGWILILIVLSAAVYFSKIVPNTYNAIFGTPGQTQVQPSSPAQTNSPLKQPTKAAQNSGGVQQPLPTFTPIADNAAPAASAAPSEPVQPIQNDTRPTLVIGEDSFGSFFIAQQIAQDTSLPFRLVVVPFDFSTEVGNPSEQDRGAKLNAGEYDLLLTTGASLSRMGNIGKVIFFVDQSNGADKIIVKQISSDGTPITTFNDLKGKKICVANGNVNHFAILAALRVAGIDPVNGVTWERFDKVSQAVDGFIAGKCEIVGAWEPEASRAIEEGNGTTLVDSKWWNNITDVAVASNQALASKQDLLKAFTTAWMKYAKMQGDNLEQAGQQVAAWTFNGQPTNDWTYIYPGSELNDMHAWLDTIAQAGLVENVVAMQNIGYFKLQITAARDAWTRAGMIVDIAPFDLDNLVYPDFINQIANDPALINGSTFANANFQPIPEDLPNAEVSQLLGVSTIVKLPCETFTFKPNSTQLSDEGKAQVRECAAASRDMILSSQGQILITGSSAWPAGYNEQQITDTAKGRAASVYQEFIRMGVPANRIAVTISLPATADRGSTNESVNISYRFVRIEIKVAGR